MMLATDSKERFSNRVEDYVRYRPGYPRAVLDLLREECGFAPESVVADIGSGTGILTQMLLENGNVVYGVEPNAEMRAAGESLLQRYARFRSVAGSAEATTLPDASVDFVFVGQAFHWFEPKAARAEFERVLKPRGWVAVIWNERKKDATAFLREYETFSAHVWHGLRKSLGEVPAGPFHEEVFRRRRGREKIVRQRAGIRFRRIARAAAELVVFAAERPSATRADARGAREIVRRRTHKTVACGSST